MRSFPWSKILERDDVFRGICLIFMLSMAIYLLVKHEYRVAGLFTIGTVVLIALVINYKWFLYKRVCDDLALQEAQDVLREIHR